MLYANLIGLAFRLKDTYELLDKGSKGVTVALIKSDLSGLKQETHHNPLYAGFPNGNYILLAYLYSTVKRFNLDSRFQDRLLLFFCFGMW